MLTDNYISLVVSPEQRRVSGPAHELYFPFEAGRVSSINAAVRVSEAKQRELAAHGIKSHPATWGPCRTYVGPVIGRTGLSAIEALR